jgi:hypothetical protein
MGALRARSNFGFDRMEDTSVRSLAKSLADPLSGESPRRVRMSDETIVNMVFAEFIEGEDSSIFLDETQGYFMDMWGRSVDDLIAEDPLLNSYLGEWWRGRSS